MTGIEDRSRTGIFRQTSEMSPVFVVGYPRSGTTLLQLLIASHPNFSSGPETYFFREVVTKLQDWQNTPLSAEEIEFAFDKLYRKLSLEFTTEFKSKIRDLGEQQNINVSDVLNEIMKYFRDNSESNTD